MLIQSSAPWSVLLALALCAAPPGRSEEVGSGAAYGAPEKWEDVVREFEELDTIHPAPRGAIVCTGSSSMRKWDDLATDLAPLTIIQRGFGGSNMNDLLAYADRLILVHRPRAVVLYEGDNDVFQGIAPRDVADTFQAFVNRMHHSLPACRIYLLSIKPSIRRWDMWPQMVAANRLMEEMCRQDERLTYVDIASGMMNEAGSPRPEIFADDDLHMNRTGYELWRDTIRPVLVTQELRYEPQVIPSR